MRAANDRERRGDTVLWETIRLQLGEERLAELCCYQAIQRIRRAMDSGQEPQQVFREIAAVLQEMGLK